MKIMTCHLIALLIPIFTFAIEPDEEVQKIIEEIGAQAMQSRTTEDRVVLEEKLVELADRVGHVHLLSQVIYAVVLELHNTSDPSSH